MPSRQTRRNGIERIGIRVQKFTCPAKKRWLIRVPESLLVSTWRMMAGETACW
ncbi:Uncharacterised protein [Vibrio cholerae]|uniref:Uncharacterized protein n=1 Tax=Vibrio cholerae TaxID=666 RepID=A0A656ALF4_VIBCL|nr:Uncharacterised protein [Vibrio cholerae]CSD18294.1 Uncharacterised protein [Vibrio cholerae]CSI55706.1 Uncharacterised protein [Vibrio cholerae]